MNREEGCLVGLANKVRLTYGLGEIAAIKGPLEFGNRPREYTYQGAKQGPLGAVPERAGCGLRATHQQQRASRAECTCAGVLLTHLVSLPSISSLLSPTRTASSNFIAHVLQKWCGNGSKRLP